MSLFDHLVDRRNKSLEMISIALEGTDFFLKHEETPQKENDNVVWMKEVEVNDKKWKLEIHLTMHFPDEPPKIYVPEASTLFLINPHIDNNGFLCTIPDSASINRDDPVGVFFFAVDCAEKILAGVDDSDFKDEFTAYWNRDLKNIETTLIITSLDELPVLFNVFFGKKYFIVANSNKIINQWMSNCISKEFSKEISLNGILVNLDSPLLPEEYPKTLFDLKNLLEMKDLTAYKQLMDQVLANNKLGFVLFSQKVNSGYALGGVNFFGLSKKDQNLIHPGFRKDRAPSSYIINQAIPIFKKSPVNKHRVVRVDNQWIHSRGGDGFLYHKKSILLIGCGSLGGYVAHLLAKAGVGNITLIDKEKLEWNNIGRHILGAESVEQSKAVALSFLIKKQMPHLQIFSVENDWREALSKNNDLFKNKDLIISTIADWTAENSLNYLSCKESLPPIIYGWLEPFAVAGHCLICVKESGCFACKMDKFGHFEYKVADFVNPTINREPGNCTTYQQYGVSALFPVASLVATNALKCLLKLPIETTLKTWISDQEHFETCKAILSDEWKEKIIDQNGYSKVYTSTIYSSPKCQVCYN